MTNPLHVGSTSARYQTTWDAGPTSEASARAALEGHSVGTSINTLVRGDDSTFAA
jgi:hypothetical protein